MLAILRITPGIIKSVNTNTLWHPTRSVLVFWNHKNQSLHRDFSTETPEKPLPFSKSKAASFSGHQFSSRRNMNDDTPWYQPFVISLSIGAILVWFCVLREENDVDKELGKSLYDRVEGLEKKQLELALQQDYANNIDTVAIQARLKELKELESTRKRNSDN